MVARTVRDRKAASSNLATPTTSPQGEFRNTLQESPAGCLHQRLRLGFRSRHALRHSDCANVLLFSVLPTVAGGGAFHALSKANFATPCKQICRVFASAPAARFPLPSRTPTQLLRECTVILRATNGRGGAFHALSKANFATPCKQICRVSASTPAAFAPQSFLSPRCSVAVLYGDPVYGFRSRHALRHSDCPNVLSFSVLPTVAGERSTLLRGQFLAVAFFCTAVKDIRFCPSWRIYIV